MISNWSASNFRETPWLLPESTVLTFLLPLSCLCLLCSERSHAEGISLGRLTLNSGKTYEEAVVTQVEADLIRIRHSVGLASIPFTELSPRLRSSLGYNPAAAKQVIAIKNQQAAAKARAFAIDQQRFMRFYEDLQSLKEWKIRYTTSSADRSLSEDEQCRRIREADLEIQAWVNKIDILKGLVFHLESDAMPESLIQKHLDAVYTNQVFNEMNAEMAKLAWGPPDELHYRNTATETKEIWNYIHSDTNKESLVIAKGVVKQITGVSL